MLPQSGAPRGGGGALLHVHDDGGTRVVDTAASANGDAIANLKLSGDSTTARWTHDSQPRSLTLH